VSFDPVNLGDLFDPARDPGKTALIAADGAGGHREFTCRQLAGATATLAAALAGRGLKRGTRIALIGANSAEYLIAYFAIMRAGLVAVPVNTRLPDETIGFILQDAAAEFAFTEPRYRTLLPSADFAAIGPGGGTEFATVTPAPHEVAMVLYTSGSTGRPKGVALSHAGQLWAIRTRLAAQIEPGRERILVAAPLYHMNALFASKAALTAGATLVLLPRFTPETYIDAIGEFACTALTSVPTMIARVVKEEARLAATNVSTVRRV
jgi:acyl-CoA synthetase (AMP-forming)/AMP-acid ligase II